MMKDRTFVISIMAIGLFLNCFSYVINAPEIDIKPDISLKNYTDKAIITKNGFVFNMNLDVEKTKVFTDKDFSYKIGEYYGNLPEKIIVKKILGNSLDVKQSFTYEITTSWFDGGFDFIPIINGFEYPEYAWFNSSFGFNSGSCIINNVTDYSMYLNVSFNDDNGMVNMNGNCQANFSDIRFITGDNTTELYHWCEYKENSKFALFWINISNEDYINIYYGHDTSIGNSSYNDGSKTFYLFEDFNDISDWTHYSSGGFTVSGGILTATSSTSYRYMYKTVTGNDYLLKSKQVITSGGNGACYNSISLESDLDTSSWVTAEADELWQMINAGNFYITRGVKHSGVLVTAVAYYNINDIWNVFYAEYNGEIKVCGLNNYIYAQNIVSGQTVYPVTLIFKLRAYATEVTKYDWLFLGKHSVVEPSFCEWTEEITNCGYNNYLVNVSPADGSIVSGINVNYITVEGVFLDGLADSINISLVADNGLFYNNDTTNVINGTYSLNVMLANFTSEQNYTFFVNITNGGCVVSYNYIFQTVYMGGYPEFQILSYKLNNIFENMIKGSDDMDINIGINTLGILLSLVIFAFAYYSDKDRLFKPILFFLDTPICLAVGISLLGNTVNSLSWWIGIIWFFFAIICSFAGLYYGLGFGRENKK